MASCSYSALFESVLRCGSSFPNGRGSPVAGFKSRVACFKEVAGFKEVASFEKVAGFEKTAL